MATKLLPCLTLCAVFSSLAQFSAAQDLSDQVVTLKPGNWERQQTVYMAGNEVPQGSVQASECLNEAEADLTVSQYVQKFLDSVGPDLVCNVVNLGGTSGDIIADISCSGAQGAATEMTLNYKYGLTNVDISGEGWSSFGGNSVPFRVVASSRYVGDCS